LYGNEGTGSTINNSISGGPTVSWDNNGSSTIQTTSWVSGYSQNILTITSAHGTVTQARTKPLIFTAMLCK
jgi:hypothetical protein